MPDRAHLNMIDARLLNVEVRAQRELRRLHRTRTRLERVAETMKQNPVGELRRSGAALPGVPKSGAGS